MACPGIEFFGFGSTRKGVRLDQVHGTSSPGLLCMGVTAFFDRFFRFVDTFFLFCLVSLRAAIP